MFRFVRKTTLISSPRIPGALRICNRSLLPRDATKTEIGGGCAEQQRRWMKNTACQVSGFLSAAPASHPARGKRAAMKNETDIIEATPPDFCPPGRASGSAGTNSGNATTISASNGSPSGPLPRVRVSRPLGRHRRLAVQWHPVGVFCQSGRDPLYPSRHVWSAADSGACPSLVRRSCRRFLEVGRMSSTRLLFHPGRRDAACGEKRKAERGKFINSTKLQNQDDKGTRLLP